MKTGNMKNINNHCKGAFIFLNNLGKRLNINTSRREEIIETKSEIKI